jgi:hypothetical protein
MKTLKCLSVLACLTGSLTLLHADETPVDVTGYDAQIVISDPSNGSGATSDMDGGGSTFYASTASISGGLPAADTLLTSEANSADQFEFQSYSGNDALLLTSSSISGVTNGTLTLDAPTEFATLSLYGAAGGEAYAGASVTLNFVGGTSVTVDASTLAKDWGGGASAADTAVGPVYREYVGSTGPSTGDGQNFDIYQDQIDLTDIDGVDYSSDYLENIEVTFDGAGHDAVFAVSGDALGSTPEPSTYAMLGAGLVALFVWSRRRLSN